VANIPYDNRIAAQFRGNPAYQVGVIHPSLGEVRAEAKNLLANTRHQARIGQAWFHFQAGYRHAQGPDLLTQRRVAGQ
jgi:hypothetical protein